MVGQHLGLIVLPMLLDLFLWLGPRLSIAPLVRQFIGWLRLQPMPDPAMTRQLEQWIRLVEQGNDRFNLLSLFSKFPLLDVPSLLAQHAPDLVTPLGEPRVFLVTSVLPLLVWIAVLIPTGLVLGFVYLNSLTRRVYDMRSPDEGKEAEQDAGTGSILTKFIKVFMFIAGLTVLMVIFMPLWSLVVGIILVIAPPIGFFVWSLSIGIFGYLALHLLFVIPGVLLGNRGLFQATLESFVLIQTRLPSIVGLIVLVMVIYEGLGFVWLLPPGDSWTMLIGILGNGCIATGLTAAMFVFYQEQVGQLPKLDRSLAKTWE